MSRVDGKFVYRATAQGDGTVPLDFALLPECRTYYVEEGHGSLPNNNTVASATIDLLRAETTARLPDEWRRNRALTRTVPETELRSQFNEKRRWGDLEPGRFARQAAGPGDDVVDVEHQLAAPVAGIGVADLKMESMDHVVVPQQGRELARWTLAAHPASIPCCLSSPYRHRPAIPFRSRLATRRAAADRFDQGLVHTSQ